MFLTIQKGDRVGLVVRVKQKLQQLRTLTIVEQRAILSKGAYGSTLLHAAVERDVLPVLQVLISTFNETKASLDLKDDAGNTPLHAAVIKGSLDSIYELLNGGARLTNTNSAGLTPSQLATIILAAEPQNLVYKKIIAILSYRETLQNTLGNIKFSYLVNLLEGSEQQVLAAKDCDKLLFIGDTGVGKSTLLNYLYGARYKVGVNVAGKDCAECIDGIEVAEPGRRGGSHTLHPLVLKKSGLNYVYCDLAGLEDTRSFEEKICAASGVQMLTSLPGSIKGIVVVLDLPGFNSLKGAAFKRTAIALANMLNFNEKLLDSVYFVITKTAPGFKIEPQAICDEFIERLLEVIEVPGEQPSEEDRALLFMLKHMQKRPHQILVPDIADHGESAKLIQELCMKLPKQSQQEFDFLNHDISQKSLIAGLVRISQDYLVIKVKLNQDYPDMLKRCYQDLEAQNQKVNQMHAEIRGQWIELGKKLHAQKTITARIFQISKHSPQVLEYETSLAATKIKIDQLQRELEDLRKNISLEIQQQRCLIAKLDNIQEENASLKLELTANKQFFMLIYKITKMLDLHKIEPIAKFWEEFDIDNVHNIHHMHRDQACAAGEAARLPAYKIASAISPELITLVTTHRTSREVGKTIAKLYAVQNRKA